jgi:predicted RNase H-like HicB family nuclease
MRYRVELIKSDEGYAVSCPDPRGCWSQGTTEEEALANIKSAIAEYLEAEAEVAKRKEVRYVEVLAHSWASSPASTTSARSGRSNGRVMRSYATGRTFPCRMAGKL